MARTGTFARGSAMAIPPLSGVALPCQRSGRGSFRKGSLSANLINSQHKIVLTAAVANSEIAGPVRALLDVGIGSFIVRLPPVWPSAGGGQQTRQWFLSTS